jgi:hypothetical protein
MTTRDFLVGAATVAFCVLLAGCGGPASDPAATAATRLHSEIGRNLPKGWKTGMARDSAVDFGARAAPDDLLIWRPEKALLRQRGVPNAEETAVRTPVCLFFTLKVCPFIKPEEYPAVYKANREVKRQHDYWNKTVSHIPRNTKGEPAPRGDEEAEQVGRYNKEYPKLPPYNPDLPTHYYDGLAFKFWDSRPVLEPEDRMLQQEMNAVFFAITKALTAYRH